MSFTEKKNEGDHHWMWASTQHRMLLYTISRYRKCYATLNICEHDFHEYTFWLLLFFIILVCVSSFILQSVPALPFTFRHDINSHLVLFCVFWTLTHITHGSHGMAKNAVYAKCVKFFFRSLLSYCCFVAVVRQPNVVPLFAWMMYNACNNTGDDIIVIFIFRMAGLDMRTSTSCTWWHGSGTHTHTHVERETEEESERVRE